MKIVLVEDDYLQADWIQASLESTFGAHVERTGSAHGLQRQIPLLARDPPDIFIVDEMLRWSDPPTVEELDAGAYLPAPDGWKPTRAGLELIEQLRSIPQLTNVPVILYTVLEESDLVDLHIPMNVATVAKNTDPGPLISAVRQALRHRR